MAQFGSAPAWGVGGRWFKSSLPDQSDNRARKRRPVRPRKRPRFWGAIVPKARFLLPAADSGAVKRRRAAAFGTSARYSPSAAFRNVSFRRLFQSSPSPYRALQPQSSESPSKGGSVGRRHILALNQSQPSILSSRFRARFAWILGRRAARARRRRRRRRAGGSRRQSERPRERNPSAHPPGLSAAGDSLPVLPEGSPIVGASATDGRDFIQLEVCHGLVGRSALSEDLAASIPAGGGSFVGEGLDLSGDEPYSRLQPQFSARRESSERRESSTV